jgi:hypothetical protein
VRPKLTYANVTATLALVIAVGGATAFAATQLAKNSVGSKQLRKNSVTTPKIKNEAITAAKVKKDTLTGKQVDSSSLGTVPAATSATNATNAANASQLGGQSPSSYARTELEPVHYVGTPGEPGFGPGCENFEPKNFESVGFYKDSFGVVHLVGMGKFCSAGNVFTLPSGYRPAKTQVFTDQSEEIGVSPEGQVVVYGSTAPELDGIAFRAAS